ncbi:MAG: hypothetical protein MJB14_21390 [Spirochaetes bacterium]|nr:hypothetical protein [Spirochaetota bacterium]
MESNYNKLSEYYSFQAYLYRVLEKELFLSAHHDSSEDKSEDQNSTMEIAIVGLLGEAFCWLSEKKGCGIGIACNLIITICKDESFKKIIDLAKWIISEKMGSDLYPSHMNELRTVIKEAIIEFIIKNQESMGLEIDIKPVDIFGKDYPCLKKCHSCNNHRLCQKLKDKRIIFQHQPIYI